jgi:hypothetical protein
MSQSSKPPPSGQVRIVSHPNPIGPDEETRVSCPACKEGMIPFDDAAQMMVALRLLGRQRGRARPAEERELEALRAVAKAATEYVTHIRGIHRASSARVATPNFVRVEANLREAVDALTSIQTILDSDKSKPAKTEKSERESETPEEGRESRFYGGDDTNIPGRW